MKRIFIILAVAALSACHFGPKSFRVETAPIGHNLDEIDNQADRLDALANKMEENGQ